MDKIEKSGLTSSLVICAYNEQETIADVLDHCLDQTQPFEAIIIVDNNSKDQTARIVQGYAEEHPRVKYMFQPIQGVMAARTMGFDAVTSDIIAKTDADTLLAPDWNEQMLMTFGSAKKPIDAAVGPARYFDAPKFFTWYELRTDLYNLPNFMHPPLLYGFNMAITKKIWQKIRAETCTNEHFFDDSDTAYHIAHSGGRFRYNRNMVVHTSARRYEDSLPKLYKYWSRFSDMQAAHGQRFLSKIHKAFAVPLILIMRCVPFRVYFLARRIRKVRTAKA